MHDETERMNPFIVAPEAVYVIFALVVLAAFIGSITVLLVAIMSLVILYAYTRGESNVSKEGVDAVIAPCDGVVEVVHNDIQRMTHVTFFNRIWDRHGVYAMYDGEVLEVNTDDMVIRTEFGVVSMKFESEPRIRLLVSKGDHVDKGDLVCFVPFRAKIQIEMPLYQVGITVEKNSVLRAGDKIGSVVQIWSTSNMK